MRSTYISCNSHLLHRSEKTLPPGNTRVLVPLQRLEANDAFNEVPVVIYPASNCSCEREHHARAGPCVGGKGYFRGNVLQSKSQLGWEKEEA